MAPGSIFLGSVSVMRHAPGKNEPSPGSIAPPLRRPEPDLPPPADRCAPER